MSPKEAKSLCHVLTMFNAIDLGEGDSVVGINQLTAMAITLANLAQPGSGIMTQAGRLIPVGSSLLVSGASSSGLILSETVPPIRRSQDNLLAHLERLLKDDAAEEQKGGPRKWSLSENTRENTAEMLLFQLLSPDPIAPCRTEEAWGDVRAARAP
jgi:hypothetical protein